MLYSKEQIQRVRDISISEMLGVKLNGRKLMIKCPHPNHRDSSPSFQLRPDNSFRCFGCGETGYGWISFCKFMGHDFRSVMNEYAENRGDIEGVDITTDDAIHVSDSGHTRYS